MAWWYTLYFSKVRRSKHPYHKGSELHSDSSSPMERTQSKAHAWIRWIKCETEAWWDLKRSRRLLLKIHDLSLSITASYCASNAEKKNPKIHVSLKLTSYWNCQIQATLRSGNGTSVWIPPLMDIAIHGIVDRCDILRISRDWSISHDRVWIWRLVNRLQLQSLMMDP